MKKQANKFLDERIKKYKANTLIEKGAFDRYKEAIIFYEPLKRLYFRHFEEIFKVYHQSYFINGIQISKIDKVSDRFIFTVSLHFFKIYFDGKAYRTDKCRKGYQITINSELELLDSKVKLSEYTRIFDKRGTDKNNRSQISNIVFNQYIAQPPFTTEESLEKFLIHLLRKFTKNLKYTDVQKKDLRGIEFCIEMSGVQEVEANKVTKFIKKGGYVKTLELAESNKICYVDDNDKTFVKEIVVDTTIEDGFNLYHELMETTVLEYLILSLGMPEVEIKDHDGDKYEFTGTISKEFRCTAELDGSSKKLNNPYNLIEELIVATRYNQFGIYVTTINGLYPYLGKRFNVEGNLDNLNNPIIGYYRGLPLRKVNYDYEYWYQKGFKKYRKII